MMDPITTRVRDFYNSLAVNCNFVCNVNEWDLTPEVNDIIAQLHPDILNRYYGSGIAVPEHVEGKRILDIGCGSGSLVFILSKLVGPTGSVVGVDMTPGLVATCMNHEGYHCNRWGYDKKNTQFFIANAENLSKLEDKSFDIVVSNGVITLVSNKDKVFAEAMRVLKDGGEFYLSDVYAEKKAPPEMDSDHKAWNLGVLGAQTVEEFNTSAHKAGFTTPYLTFVGPVELGEEYKNKLQGRRYCGAGNRMFRLGGAGKRGPASVTYRGNIKGHASEFRWDVSLTFKTGQPVTVDGELATILTSTRYRDAFDISDATGSTSTQRAQNPFKSLDHLASQGKTPSPVYTLE